MAPGKFQGSTRGIFGLTTWQIPRMPFDVHPVGEYCVLLFLVGIHLLGDPSHCAVVSTPTSTFIIVIVVIQGLTLGKGMKPIRAFTSRKSLTQTNTMNDS